MIQCCNTHSVTDITVTWYGTIKTCIGTIKHVLVL